MRAVLRSRPQGELPTREQAVLACLTALGLVLVAGLLVFCTAALTGLVAGVELRDLKALLSDPAGSPLVSSPGWIVFGVAANEAALLLALAYWIRHCRVPWRMAVPVGRPPRLALAAALALVFGLAPFAELASYGAGWLTGEAAPATEALTLAAHNATHAELGLLVLSVAGLPALAEEALFRGFVTEPFLRISKASAIFFPSLMFGLFHLDPVQAAGTFVLGIGFALARLMTGSVVAAMVAHAAYNAAVVLAVRFSTEPDEPAIKWNALLAGAALLVLAAVLYARDRRSRRLLARRSTAF